MKRGSGMTFCFLFLPMLALTCGTASAQADKKGCKDHPLFSRMPSTYITSCDEKEFEGVDFREPPSGQRVVRVEGKYTQIEYRVFKELEGKRSATQVHRNYANAIKSVGGSSYEYTSNSSSLKHVKDGGETWVNVYGNGDAFSLTIIEKGPMVQEVVADANVMAGSIGTTGHAAVYGIYFDVNKADVKPESEPALKEIARLLSGNPNLKVYVVGHTDDVGGLDYNMKLSHARADAVVGILTSRHGMNPNRLIPLGVGPIAPVSTNKTEEGRAKNRRVELVER
jgi:outer membrane protein OmpA-like peptidoglycan-associated protein